MLYIGGTAKIFNYPYDIIKLISDIFFNKSILNSISSGFIGNWSINLNKTNGNFKSNINFAVL